MGSITRLKSGIPNAHAGALAADEPLSGGGRQTGRVFLHAFNVQNIARFVPYVKCVCKKNVKITNLSRNSYFCHKFFTFRTRIFHFLRPHLRLFYAVISALFMILHISLDFFQIIGIMYKQILIRNLFVSIL